MESLFLVNLSQIVHTSMGVNGFIVLIVLSTGVVFGFFILSRRLQEISKEYIVVSLVVDIAVISAWRYLIVVYDI